MYGPSQDLQSPPVQTSLCLVLKSRHCYRIAVSISIIVQFQGFNRRRKRSTRMATFAFSRPPGLGRSCVKEAGDGQTPALNFPSTDDQLCKSKVKCLSCDTVKIISLRYNIVKVLVQQ